MEKDMAEVTQDAVAGSSTGSLLSRKTLKRAVSALALGAGIAAAAWYGNYYWKIGQYLQSTDDAYVNADYTTVAPKVSGYITEVLVEDNQAIKAGQILARIAERVFRT